MSMVRLDAAERDQLRADFDAALLPDLATIRRKVDGEWGDVAGDVPARFNLPGRAVHDALSEAAARVGADAVVRFTATADVRLGDRLVIEGRAMVVKFVVPATRAHLTVLAAIEAV